MADIRINSLPTTASASSSDDFLALDGATNGTRKLNAFSPTFGGNLTVSGTGTVTGDVTITRASSGGGVGVRNVNTDSSGYASLTLSNSGGTAQSFDIGTGGSAVAVTASRQKLYIYDNTAGTTVMRLSGGSTSAVEFLGTGTHSFAGNLTVSGTGTSSFQSTTPPTVQIANTTSGLADTQTAANNVVLGTLKFGHPSDGQSDKFPSIVGRFDPTDASFARSTQLEFYTSTASGNALAMTLTKTGNLIIGTTTDGGQKLQVSGTAAITDQTILGSSAISANQLLSIKKDVATYGLIGLANLSASGYSSIELFNSSSSQVGAIGYGNASVGVTGVRGKVYMYSTGDIAFLSGGTTTALTLDSSQNATFAGSYAYLSKSAIGSIGFRVHNTNQTYYSTFRASNNINYTDATSIDFGIGGTTEGGNFQNYGYIYTGSSVNGFRLLTNGNNIALTVDNSKNATFEGTVVASKATTAFRIPTAETPASASATGTVGTITWDASYIYVCTAANTWKRVAIATW